jgi:hypothetical protein
MVSEAVNEREVANLYEHPFLPFVLSNNIVLRASAFFKLNL